MDLHPQYQTPNYQIHKKAQMIASKNLNLEMHAVGQL